MLNLSIAMLRLILLFSLLFQDPAVSIDSPRSGAILRGQAEIIGSMNVQNFASAELAFGFSHSADAWFTIQTFPQPKTDAPLAVWDTTSVTDGDYNLRLRVALQDGSIQEVIVTGLQIRNDSPEPTPTPTQDLQFIASPVLIATAIPATPTLPPFALAPTLPANPASLTVTGVYSTFGRGALVALALFVVISFLFRYRKD